MPVLVKIMARQSLYPSFHQKVPHHLPKFNPTQNQLALMNRFHSLHIVTSPLQEDEQVTIWTGFQKRWLRMMGTCNGLIFLKDVERHSFLLNPITRQQVQMLDLTRPGLIMVYGFGYDSSTDDCKVVRISYTHTSHHENEERNGGVPLVDVYSVKRGFWYKVNDVYPYGQLVPSSSLSAQRDFLNGAVHWFISERSEWNSGLHCHIAAFDLTNEVFHEIPMPVMFDRTDHALGEYWINRPSYHNGPTVLGGCLSIIDNLGNANTDVWVMREYGVVESWLKFHISPQNHWKLRVPLSFNGYGQLIYYTAEKDVLVACDLKDGTTKKVIVGGADTMYWDGRAFVDTLMSPGKYECNDGSS